MPGRLNDCVDGLPAILVTAAVYDVDDWHDVSGALICYAPRLFGERVKFPRNSEQENSRVETDRFVRSGCVLPQLGRPFDDCVEHTHASRDVFGALHYCDAGRVDDMRISALAVADDENSVLNPHRGESFRHRINLENIDLALSGGYPERLGHVYLLHFRFCSPIAHLH